MDRILSLLLLLVMIGLMLCSCNDGNTNNNDNGDNGNGGNEGNEDLNGDTNNGGDGSDDSNINGGNDNNTDNNDKTEDGDDKNDGNNDASVIPELGSEVGKLAVGIPLDLIRYEGKDSIDNHRGKIVVINFWGTWCGPCKSELPHFNTLAEEYSEDVVFFLVHSVTEAEDPLSYINKYYSDSNMIFVRDVPLSATGDMYYSMLNGNGFYPRTLVLDSKGVITFIKSGAISYDDLKSEIDKAMQ